jgi:hypothetical protein
MNCPSALARGPFTACPKPASVQGSCCDPRSVADALRCSSRLIRGGRCQVDVLFCRSAKLDSPMWD